MTPEERFTRIESNLERLEIDLEKSRHEHDARLRKLEEMQSVLMDAQNSTWAAIRQLTANIDRLTQGRGPNGHEG